MRIGSSQGYGSHLYIYIYIYIDIDRFGLPSPTPYRQIPTGTQPDEFFVIPSIMLLDLPTMQCVLGKHTNIAELQSQQRVIFFIQHFMPLRSKKFNIH